MLRHEQLLKVRDALRQKGTVAKWPLRWGEYALLPAEKDWLINEDAYRAKWPQLMSSPRFAPPPAANAEQASSQATALWRGRWLRGLTLAQTWSALDLSAGSGIDTWGMESAGARVTAVEPDAYLAELLRWNGAEPNRIVVQAPAEEQSFAPDQYDVVYADPSRRSERGRLPLNDLGSPDPLKHLQTWQQWAPHVVLKLSPMLDVEQVARWFPGAESLTYLSTHREVKELVVHLPRTRTSPLRVFAVAVDDEGTELVRWTSDPQRTAERATAVGTYLYDPDSVLVAARGAASWAAHHGLKGLHPDSRLYTADELHAVPGCRVFRVDAVHTSLPTHLTEASVVCRAFPERADVLRKRLKLGESSERFLVATQLSRAAGYRYLEATRIA
ncbi:MAG: class I SAM-dependent methyltransferase [Bacteroidetes bacterium]|nr:class I SAM-dependent methyltransferase [Bacteroidota bacterium]